MSAQGNGRLGKGERKKRLREKEAGSRKSVKKTSTPGPAATCVIRTGEKLPLFGHLYESHPLRKHVSDKKALRLGEHTKDEMLNTICSQNAVVGCLVKALYTDPESGLQYDVNVRRVCLSYLSDRTGVQFNSRRFAGATGKTLENIRIWGRDFDFEFLDDLDKTSTSPLALCEAQAAGRTSNSCVLWFRSNKLTVVGRSTFEGSYATAVQWCRLMTEHFEHERMHLKFYPCQFSLDNAVCTAYAPTTEQLDLDLITATLPRTTYSPGLFPMCCVRFQFWCECTGQDETIVILLSNAGRILFTKIKHPFEAVCAWRVFWSNILSLFVAEAKPQLESDATRNSMLAYADEHLREIDEADITAAKSLIGEDGETPAES